MRNAERGNFVREPAADQFGDFERAHPDAAHVVNVDDFGQRLFLLRRPGRQTDAAKRARGRSGWPCAAQFFDAPGPAEDFRCTAALMISINLANGNSNGMVANSAPASGETASGGVTVAAGSRHAHPFAERRSNSRVRRRRNLRRARRGQTSGAIRDGRGFRRADGLPACADKSAEPDGRRSSARSASSVARASDPSARKASADRARSKTMRVP